LIPEMNRYYYYNLMETPQHGPAEKLITKIHGRYFDLTAFKHPGGPIALGLVAGRDGTELFESHHIFTDRDVKGMLAAFEVKDHPDVIESSGVYDWAKTLADPFTLELKEAARAVLGKDIKATYGRFCVTWTLFLVVVLQLPVFSGVNGGPSRPSLSPCGSMA